MIICNRPSSKVKTKCLWHAGILPSSNRPALLSVLLWLDQCFILSLKSILWIGCHNVLNLIDTKHLKYRACAIITRSWFETSLDYKPRILHPKIEEFPCLVHELSVTLTALQYKPHCKMEERIYKPWVIMAHKVKQQQLLAYEAAWR